MSASPTSSLLVSSTFLRLALGFVYFHFGLLKFFPDLSPAEALAFPTLGQLSLHQINPRTALALLALLECGIGTLLIFNLLPRVTFGLFLFHMTGTFLPLFLLPEFTFKIAPLAPTLEGQYILKNLVFVAAGWTVLRPACREPATNDSPHRLPPDEPPPPTGSLQ